MARLAAMEKGEYYPTPLSIADQIAGYLEPSDGRGTIQLLDPCCGAGRALARIARQVASRATAPVETWGVEISPTRAAEAAERLDLVVEAPFQAVTWSPRAYGAASFALLNPPYDHNARGGRMEHDFLKQATYPLIAGGVLAYIIPATIIKYPLARTLHEHYEDVRLFRFGGEGAASFGQFKQVVILARKRRESIKHMYRHPEVQRSVNELYETYGNTYERTFRRPQDVAEYEREVPAALPPGMRYEIRPTRTRANLRRERWLPPEIDALAQARWPVIQAAIAEHMEQSAQEIPQPLMPPSVGHVAQVVAAGMAGNLEGDGQVFKGRVVKKTETVPHVDDASKVVERERYETHICTVSSQGLEHLSKPSAVEAFLKEHIDDFTEALKQKLMPYGNTVTSREEAVLSQLSKDKRLPGREEAGLLPKQKEIAVALTRSLRRHGIAHLVGEMGVGKTRMSLAAVELDGRYPALVITPPHVVDKWTEEAEGAIPGVKAYVAESIGDLEMIRAQHEPGDRTVVVVARSYVKLGSGWERRQAVRRTLPVSDKDSARGRFRRASTAYRCERRKLLHMPQGPEREEQRRITAQARREALEAATRVPVCPNCGKPLSKANRESSNPVRCDGQVEVWDEIEGQMTTRPCRAALFQFGARYHRVPLAQYIVDKMPGFFQSFVCDEVHQYKAKSTDQGWAFGLLAAHVPVTITLTGTFYGGPASSIFWILHRTQSDVRQDYGFDDATRWIRRFGVMETTYKLEDGAGGYGAYTGKKRRRCSTRERPGINPGIVRYLLPTTVFVRLKDLGIKLPSFHEEMVKLEQTEAMSQDLSRVERFTWDQMMTYWPHYTSSWLQWNLARPNSCFRDELIEGYDDEELECPAVVGQGERLPKEAWLANTVENELAEGRRVVLYVRQTGTRDIRGRLKEVLEQKGVKVAVLDSSIDPREREEWLEKRHPQVLITNPQLVETGLDLVEYCTVVFFEAVYSLYTMWQACRRVWRLGQTRPVKVYYVMYRGTLEEKAYALIGEKFKAAKLLHGEDVSGALVPEAGESSLVMSLVKAIKAQEDLQLTNTTFFGDDTDQVVSVSPTGSMVHRSAMLNGWQQWCKERGVQMDEIKPKPRRRRASKPQPGQMRLEL